MKRLKIEKEVTVEDVYVFIASPTEAKEADSILIAAGEKFDGLYPYLPSQPHLVYHQLFAVWFYNQGSLNGTQITISQLAELLGVEYPLKPKFEVGKWYIAKGGTNIFCHNGKFDGDGDPCGYGVVCDEWGVANDVGWGGDYREATPSEVEKALIAEAKRRYKPADKLSRIVQDFAPDGDGRVYPSNPAFGYTESGRLWLDQEYYYCIFADGKWAEVIEQKQLPTLEELIAEAKSKVTVKSETYPCWVEGMREIKVYRMGGMSYTSEKSAIAAYISKKIREEYL